MKTISHFLLIIIRNLLKKTIFKFVMVKRLKSVSNWTKIHGSCRRTNVVDNKDRGQDLDTRFVPVLVQSRSGSPVF